MTSGYLTALIAFSGSVITGFISFFAAWFIQRRNESVQSKIAERSRRQKVYRRFIEEAARLYADALAKSTFDTAVLVGIYALVGRMRILSSVAVVDKASSVIETIVDASSNLINRRTRFGKSSTAMSLIFYGSSARRAAKN